MTPEQRYTMYDFFHLALEKLNSRTGFKQLENMMQKETWKEDVDELIAFMIEETKKPPFNVVQPVVIQRVIWNAIVEDKEFIGLNAKFVSKALHAWWIVNGDRLMQKLNQKDEVKIIQRTPEENKALDEKLNKFVAEILSGDGMQTVPKVENAKRAGAEWTSNLERKAIQHVNGISEQEYTFKRHLQRVAGEFYRHKTSFSLKEFFIEGWQIMSESEADAKAIYLKATEE